MRELEKYFLEELKEIGVKYEGIWKNLNIFLEQKNSSKKKLWQEWCFLPASQWAHIVNIYISTAKLNQLEDLELIPFLGSWRYTQSTYKFDDNLLSELKETEFKGDLPVSVFYRLPEFCIFVEAEINNYDGFFIFLNDEILKNGQPIHELRIMFFNKKDVLYEEAYPLQIREKATIDQSIKESMSYEVEYFKKYIKDGHSDKNLFFSKRIELLQSPQYIYHTIKTYKRIIPLILYICSDSPEIDLNRQPVRSFPRPELKKIRRGFQIFPPDKPKHYFVGREIGEKLRQYNNSEPQTLGTSKRSHIRRGHWHGYWTGPKQGERKFKYNWIHPLLVGINNN